jgi:hypothetical protein
MPVPTTSDANVPGMKKMVLEGKTKNGKMKV